MVEGVKVFVGVIEGVSVGVAVLLGVGVGVNGGQSTPSHAPIFVIIKREESNDVI